jgi:vitamin B12/bleomycin/antimicrobial peptide transport system ATP-binding/permease protein
MQKISVGAFVRDFRALARPYWVSEEKWRARGLLALIVTLSLTLVYVSVLINRWTNLFFNAIERHDVSAFVHQLLHFCVLASLFVASAIHQTYFTQLLEIRWRRWLTRHTIARWLADQTYYRLQLQNAETDNPDQRIAEDLRLFVGVTLTLGMGFLSSLVTVISFVAILWRLSGVLNVSVAGASLHIYGFMVWAALLYAATGTWVTHLIGNPLIQLNFAQQSFEANFRFTLVRFRENSESVAFYRGEADEERNFAQRFSAVFHNWRAIMRRQKRISSFTIAYSQVALVFPFLAAAPRYIAGAITLGGLTQSVSAFTQLQAALSWFVNVYGSIAEWRATIARLNDFDVAIEKGRERRRPQRIEAPVAPHGPERRKDYIRVVTGSGRQLRTEDLTVNFPDGRPLLSDVSICIEKGESALLVGPSGSGKTTFLRAIAELWPFGHGQILKPAVSMLFLPQRPYLPVGTLTEVVTYPGGAEHYREADVREALTLCGLSHLNDHLEKFQNWALKLPSGEQQRIAFARAVLLKPEWLFLDEATSALDASGEADLYKMIKKHLQDSTLFSISHHRALATFHSRRFETRAATEGWIMVEEVKSAREEQSVATA